MNFDPRPEAGEISLLDSHLARVCGLQPLDHVHFGGVTPGMSESAFAACMATVDQTAVRLFASTR
jgi:hypothetical protein